MVWGGGRALNYMGGYGKPVPLDPRKVDWAAFHYGGEWKEVDGENVYVGGRTQRLIPQASLVRAIGKSISAIERGEPETMIRAWEQLAYSRTTPGLQSPAALGGIGFNQEGRFFFGNLPMEDRLLAAAPLPITGQEAISGEMRSPQEAALGVAGFAGFPGESEERAERRVTGEHREEVLREVEQAAPTVKRGWDSDYWKQQFSAAGLSVDPGKSETFEEYRDAWIDYWVERRPEGMTKELARDRVSRRFAALPVVRTFQRRQQRAMERYWRQNVELMKRAIDANVIDATDERMRILDEAGLLTPAR